MKVLRKIYTTINNSIQSHSVKDADEANKYIISLNRTLEDRIFLEESGNKQIEAIKVNGKWHLCETEIVQ